MLRSEQHSLVVIRPSSPHKELCFSTKQSILKAVEGTAKFKGRPQYSYVLLKFSSSTKSGTLYRWSALPHPKFKGKFRCTTTISVARSVPSGIGIKTLVLCDKPQAELERDWVAGFKLFKEGIALSSQQSLESTAEDELRRWAESCTVSGSYETLEKWIELYDRGSRGELSKTLAQSEFHGAHSMRREKAQRKAESEAIAAETKSLAQAQGNIKKAAALENRIAKMVNVPDKLKKQTQEARAAAVSARAEVEHAEWSEDAAERLLTKLPKRDIVRAKPARSVWVTTHLKQIGPELAELETIKHERRRWKVANKWKAM